MVHSRIFKHKLLMFIPMLVVLILAVACGGRCHPHDPAHLSAADTGNQHPCAHCHARAYRSAADTGNQHPYAHCHARAYRGYSPITRQARWCHHNAVSWTPGSLERMGRLFHYERRK